MKKQTLNSVFTIFLSIFILGGLFSFARPAEALSFTAPTIKDAVAYKAKYQSQSVSDPVTIEAGKTKEVIIKFKNTGTATWNASGNKFISAYTMDPRYRESKFSGSDWLDATNPAKISATTKPGATAEIKLKLHAPSKTGTYREQFWLAAENYSWVDGGYFYLDIKVIASTGSTVSSGSSSATVTSSTVSSSGNSASLAMIKSRTVSAANGGDKIDFIVVWQNDGDKEWKNLSWREAGSTELKSGGTSVAIADSSWVSQKVIMENTETIAPKKVKRLNFSFRAPVKKGSYTTRFQLYVDGSPIEGGLLELPVTVVADAPSNYSAATFTLAQSLIAEPKIRVGLFKSDTLLQFRSEYTYQVFVGATYKGELPAQSLASLSYTAGTYKFASDYLTFSGTDLIRLVPYDLKNNFEIVNYDRTVSWKSGYNYNKYRGILEYAYSPKSEMPYIINELLLNDYVAGIGETSNGAAMEYIKAILTAARSYAYYYISHAGESDMFNVYPTTVDQLYLGYNSEVSMPRVVQAAVDTYGEVIYYNNEPVITPYFGNSDGYTRTWSEVWGGSNKPWLQSVDCKYDAGKALWGHGVGMSAADAAARADKDGWTHLQLLNHYYTGVEVKRLF